MKFIINVDRLLKSLPPSEYFGILQGEQVTIYKTMLKCVADDDGNMLTEAAAKRAIDEMAAGSMAQFVTVQNDFIRALSDALVNPTSGNG